MVPAFNPPLVPVLAWNVCDAAIASVAFAAVWIPLAVSPCAVTV